MTTHVGRVDAAHHVHLLGARGKRIATADEEWPAGIAHLPKAIPAAATTARIATWMLFRLIV